MRTRDRVHLSSGAIILPLFLYSIPDRIFISTGAILKKTQYSHLPHLLLYPSFLS